MRVAPKQVCLILLSLAHGLGFLVALDARAARRDLDLNLREICRQQVAGKYLDVYDRREQAQHFGFFLEKKIAQLQRVLRPADRELRKLRQREIDDEFDLQLAYDIRIYQSKVDLYNERIAESSKMLTSARERGKSADLELKRIEKRMTEIFRIEKREASVDGRYPINITYRSHCPKYRFLCPLPKKQAMSLSHVFGKDQAPLACRRYAELI